MSASIYPDHYLESSYGIVYKITNHITHKSYIGSTTDYKRRFQNHDHLTGAKDSELYNDLSQYPEGCWEWEVLALADDASTMADYERHFILKYDTINNGYNNTLATKPTRLGTGHTYIFTDPIGITHIVSQGPVRFCDDKPFSFATVRKSLVHDGRIVVNERDTGWSVRIDGTEPLGKPRVDLNTLTWVFTGPDRNRYRMTARNARRFCKDMPFSFYYARVALDEDGVIRIKGEDTGWSVKTI